MNTLHIRFIIIIILASLFGFGCTKSEDLTEQVNNMDFSGGYRSPNEIDNWLMTNITQPYNIQIKYYWDRSELALNKSITPVDESKVIPVAQILLSYFLKPYEAETSNYFIKTYPPKQYVLVGSAEYNSNGSVTVGSAEAGKKITLYRLNAFSPSNRDSLLRVLKTVHHEFTHILNQNAVFPPEFKAVSAPADYLGDEWVNHSDEEAYPLGFVTAYARDQPKEDFAETAAILLVYGQQNFNDIVEMAGIAGAAKLRTKETMIVEYFRQLWNIDFRSLQARIQNLLPPPPPPPALKDFLGYGKQFVEFKFIETDPTLQKSSVWVNTVLPGIKADLVTYEAGRTLDYLLFNFNETNGQLRLRIYSKKADGSSSNSSMRFNIVWLTDSTFKLVLADPLSGTLFNSMITLRNWMGNNTFKMDFQGKSKTVGGIYVVGQEATNFVTGALN